MGYTGFGKVKVKNIKNFFSANFRYVCEALIRRVKFSKQAKYDDTNGSCFV